jgi:2,4-dienoyl-CoA reductase-like NADH-dependent reductase (Old Yellow Enzyme family)
MEGGWTQDDTVALARILENRGVDLMDCSSGGIVPHARIPFGPGFQLGFAESVRKTGIMTGAVGFITSAIQAESILTAGQADLVLLAREFLRNPYFPLHAARELGFDLNWPVQYIRSKPQ